MQLRHILSTKQFLDRQFLEEIFSMADHFRTKAKSKFDKTLSGKILVSLFYEPSTRTRFSFEAAMLKLGGEVISTESAGHFSSAMKGESLEDTVRVIGGYADVIVLRHPEVGAAERAARISAVPIINAGDGQGEHPTQALLDLYTIRTELGRTHDITIALVGDLLYGRTIHSLIHLLSLYRNIKIFLVSPRELRLPAEYKSFLKNKGVYFREAKRLDAVISSLDVLYMTRVQKERFRSSALYESVKNAFVVDRKILQKLPKRAIIMHPLPRLKEISPAIDGDPRAAYFRQSQNGLYIRMALLWRLFKKETV